MVEFKLPDIGEGISEAEIIEWRVKEGDAILEGDLVAEVSTDKVNVELSAPATGRVAEIRVAAGTVVPVGTIVMLIEPLAQKKPPAEAPKQREPTPVQGLPASAPAETATTNSKRSLTVHAAPAVKRLASDLGVDLAAVVGTGPTGRILMRDVEAARDSTSDTAAGVHAEPLNRMRMVAAERLARSARDAVTTTTTFVVNAERLIALVTALREEASAQGLKLSPLAIVAKCVGATLQRNPRFNATINAADGVLLIHDDVNIGIAVATDQGLVVPVVKRVTELSVFGLGAAINESAERARNGRLQPEHTSGGTFTLSSTGGTDRSWILSTQPVINPPQTATMWMSRIDYWPWADASGVHSKLGMVFSLSFDHRYVNGQEASGFINDLTRYVEQPAAVIS